MWEGKSGDLHPALAWLVFVMCKISETIISMKVYLLGYSSWVPNLAFDIESDPIYINTWTVQRNVLWKFGLKSVRQFKSEKNRNVMTIDLSSVKSSLFPGKWKSLFCWRCLHVLKERSHSFFSLRSWSGIYAVQWQLRTLFRIVWSISDLESLQRIASESAFRFCGRENSRISFSDTLATLVYSICRIGCKRWHWGHSYFIISIQIILRSQKSVWLRTWSHFLYLEYTCW